MAKVPDGIRTNSMPKVFVKVFSKPEVETEKKTTHRTMMNPKNIRKVFLDIIAILLIETPFAM
jgi:hypothetical protein